MTEQHLKDLKELKEVMQSQGDGYDYKMVEKAFDLCVTAHEGQKGALWKTTIYIH